MKALTARDEAANDLWHLLSEKTPRSDCPEILNDPAKIPEPATFVEESDMDDRPLPESGNMIGFLQILLKAEIEIAKKVGLRSEIEIIKDFTDIITHKHAREYVTKMKQVLEDITD